MIQKSLLRETINEVLEEHDIEDADLLDNLVDRLQGVIEVMDDDEEEAEEEIADEGETLGDYDEE
jgi:hypothetical protein